VPVATLRRPALRCCNVRSTMPLTSPTNTWSRVSSPFPKSSMRRSARALRRNRLGPWRCCACRPSHRGARDAGWRAACATRASWQQSLADDVHESVIAGWARATTRRRSPQRLVPHPS
jgi:hypothetical protein